MNLQSIMQAVASVTNVLSVIVLDVGYYFMVRLYCEWLRPREETRAAGGRPLVVASYDHPEVNVTIVNDQSGRASCAGLARLSGG